MTDTANLALPPGWEDPLAVLRSKWGEVPSGESRQSSAQLLAADPRSLVEHWNASRDHDTEGIGFGIRGWYHEAYRTLVSGKKLLDIGCGLGLSTLCFAEMGARVTFTDIISDNVELVRRLCAAKGVDAEFLYIDTLEDYESLARDYDMVTSIGSMHHMPLVATKMEINRIKSHLKVGGRWLHFTYPKSRWEREGRLSFSRWGSHTDGPGTPWAEYHDRDKVEWLFAPSKIRVLFECEWHNSDFNWFDIELLQH
jgi:2-polyprenyl-3-methyl-5-hydroxy-6-metoxy-1,4-benzoquinol methylase